MTIFIRIAGNWKILAAKINTGFIKNFQFPARKKKYGHCNDSAVRLERSSSWVDNCGSYLTITY